MQAVEIRRNLPLSPSAEFDPARMVPYGFDETDYGTPVSKSSEMVTLTIDGQSVTVPAGTSIMRTRHAGAGEPCGAGRSRHGGDPRHRG